MTVMTPDNQSNARRIEVASKENHTSNRRVKHQSQMLRLGVTAAYDLNSHGARTVAVESHGHREIFLDIFYPSYDES